MCTCARFMRMYQYNKITVNSAKLTLLTIPVCNKLSYYTIQEEYEKKTI